MPAPRHPSQPARRPELVRASSGPRFSLFGDQMGSIPATVLESSLFGCPLGGRAGSDVELAQKGTLGDPRCPLRAA
eukprot:7636438-Pyramimonas_sp.AAC.1